MRLLPKCSTLHIDRSQEHATVEIENSVGTINLHYLYIPVDIPYIDVIHTVSLQLHGDTLKAPAEVQHVALGQAIPAQLVIQHNRKWSDPSSTPGDVVEFCFEVHANPETWLIGGHRKAYFSARVRDMPLPYVCLYLSDNRSIKPSPFHYSCYPSGRVTYFIHRLILPSPVDMTVAMKRKRRVPADHPRILLKWTIEIKVIAFSCCRIVAVLLLASTSKTPLYRPLQAAEGELIKPPKHARSN